MTAEFRMPRGAFIEAVEYAPGCWCAPGEESKLKAAAPTLEDANATTRRMTPDQIPNLGSPVEFWAVAVVLLIACYLWG